MNHSSYGSLVILLIILLSGCSSNPYESSSPGTLKVTMISELGSFKATENDTFKIVFYNVEAIREDGAYAEIFDHPRAVIDNPDSVNIFSAVDQPIVIGQTYLPPDKFLSLRMRIEPGKNFKRGRSQIPITKASDFVSTVILDKEFTIETDNLTEITVAFVIDSSLQKRAESFAYRSYFRLVK